MLHRAADAGGAAAARQSTAKASSPRGSLRAASLLRGSPRAAPSPRASGAASAPVSLTAPGAPQPATHQVTVARALPNPVILHADAGAPPQAAAWGAPSPRSPYCFAAPALAHARSAEPDLAHGGVSGAARAAPPLLGAPEPCLAQAGENLEAGAAALVATGKGAEARSGAAELPSAGRQAARASEALRWRGAQAKDAVPSIA